MTKTYAARQLLALGPLSFTEFVEITGWSRAVCRWVLTYLVDALGQVRRADGLYWIANANQLPDLRELEAQAKPSDGEAQIRPVCSGASVGFPSTAANLRPAQTGCCGRCRGAQQVGGEGLNHEITGPSGSGA